MRIAITREVNPTIAACQLNHLAREAIDVNIAHWQHRQYERLLADLGCTIQRLPAQTALPDAVFVEDTAVILNELAVIMHPGAETRRAETTAVARRLQKYRRLQFARHQPHITHSCKLLRL